MEESKSGSEISAYDARFSDILGGKEYDDLLIALEFYNEFQSETGAALRTYISEHCKDSKVVKVLEAGPGTGITTFELLKADPRVKVVSVDNEPRMLEAVKGRFAKVAELKERVEFVFADILRFLEECPDGSFDAFASVYTLHNFTPDFRRKVIELISKKIKKGVVFINGDKYAETEQLHKKDLENEIKNFNKFDIAADKAEKGGDRTRAEHLRQIKKEWIDHTWEDDKNRISMEKQNEMFRELGFTDIEWGKRYDLVATVQAIKS
jgi:ubiquinone/menaquinone biosynthesis C-methylase UbiE